MDVWEFLQQPLILTVARWGVGLVFLLAGMSKLRNHRRFVSVVLTYQVLPKRMAVRFAQTLPWLEVAVGLLLLLGVVTQVASALSAAMLLSFMIAMGLNLWRGRTALDCGCSGVRSRPISKTLLVRNSLLLLLCLWISLWDSGAYGLQDRFLVSVTRRQWNLTPDTFIPTAFSLVGLRAIHQLVRHLVILVTERHIL